MELFRREQYLSKIRGFYHDTDIIKVITGVRRCGKSSLMEMIKDELISGGVSEDRKQTEDREYKPLEMIRDNYMKYVVTTDYLLQKRNGIKHINILEFMKEGKKF